MKFRVIMVTHPQTNIPTNTQTQRQLQYTAPQLASVQCNNCQLMHSNRDQDKTVMKIQLIQRRQQITLSLVPTNLTTALTLMKAMA